MSEIKNPLAYYINGGISGMCGILLSHPVDTIKTHIQTGKPLSLIKQYSFVRFYQGITAPLIGVGIEKAIVFGTYNYIKRVTDGNTAIAGAIAGLNASLIVTPYERFKILKQQNVKVGHYREIINPRYLFKGLSATFTREVPGFAIYFSVYERLKNNRQIEYYEAFTYGGISGIVAWIFIYPQDRIKTILQSETGKSLKIRTLITNIYNQGGWTQFYKGFSWAVARASLLHSGTFLMMEVLDGVL